MVTLGQKEFQSGYEEVSRRTDQTRNAGAEILREADVGRMVAWRGTSWVVRPDEGGQGVDIVGWMGRWVYIVI